MGHSHSDTETYMPGIYPYKRRGVPTNFLSMVGVYPDTEDPVVADPLRVVHDKRERRGESSTSGRLKKPTQNTLRSRHEAYFHAIDTDSLLSSVSCLPAGNIVFLV